MRKQLSQDIRDRLRESFKREHSRDPEDVELPNLETDTGHLVQVLLEKVGELEDRIINLEQPRTPR